MLRSSTNSQRCRLLSLLTSVSFTLLHFVSLCALTCDGCATDYFVDLCTDAGVRYRGEPAKLSAYEQAAAAFIFFNFLLSVAATMFAVRAWLPQQHASGRMAAVSTSWVQLLWTQHARAQPLGEMLCVACVMCRPM